VQRMSALDASFLLLEDASTLLRMAWVEIFEGPVPSHDEFRQLVRGVLPLSRRLRQKVRSVPFDLARPVWVDDPHFNLDYHLRRTALPAPGDDDQLRLLVGRIMSQHLDRTRPLWELWVVEGLAEGTWAPGAERKSSSPASLALRTSASQETARSTAAAEVSPGRKTRGLRRRLRRSEGDVLRSLQLDE